MLDPKKLSPQQKEILSATGNILVSASAGSGKTTMMIEKVMALLLNGADIRRILIMTFTNDAASEMKSRLIENIYKELREGSKYSSMLKKQLEYLPFANIGTMDSYWKTLYQKYFAVIGKDPSCNILEANEATLMLNQSIMKVFQNHIENNDEEFFKLAEALNTGRRLDMFGVNIIKVRNFMTAQVDEEAFINTSKSANIYDKSSPMTNYVLEHFRRQFKIAIKHIAPFIDKFNELEADDFVQQNVNFSSCAQDIIESVNFEDFCEKLKNIVVPQKIGKKIKECSFVAEYAAFIDSIKKIYSSAIDFGVAYRENNQNGNGIDKLLELLCETEYEYSKIKAQKNLLDFNDLSKFAVKILQDENTRNQVKSSFDYIFVDEYQDTNYRQEMLLESISNGNNIFVVGDVKQAIYHFRNAEPAIFIDRMNIYESQKTGSKISLNNNYRSDKSILKFVDNICGELMTSNFGGVDYKNTANFIGAAEYKKVDDLSPVNVAILNQNTDNKDTKENSVYTVKSGDIASEDVEPDYAFVAQKISEIVGNNQIYNIKTAQTTTIDYGDIAILVREWKQAYKIGEALNLCNVPFNILNNEKKDSKERELLVDYLSILFNPTKDILLTNVLFSEICNFTAKELLEIRSDNTKVSLWESILSYKGNQDIVCKVDNFVKKLEKLRYLSSYCTVSELLQSILQDGYDAILLDKGEKVIGEINAFIQFIAKSEINNSLEDFLDFYEHSYKGNVSPKINNAVTVTTIFKSKGLEYPIVFVPCLSNSLLKEYDKSIIYTDNVFGVAIKSIFPQSYAIKDNFSVMAHKLKEKQIRREEMVRVLYVALTRAKNHLFLSGKQGKQVAFLEEASSIMDWLEYAKLRNPAIGIYFSSLDEVVLDEEIMVETVDKHISLEDIKQGYRYEKATKAYAKMSVSQVLEQEREEGVFNLNSRTVESIRADLGIAYHAVIQQLTYKERTIEDINDIIDLMVKDGNLSDVDAKKVNPNIVFGILNWEVIQNNINNKFYREQSFMLYMAMDGESRDKTLIQGVVDLFIVDKVKNTAVVIDFKVTNASSETLKKRYRRQLELYALAVEKLSGVKVNNKYIYNILHGCGIDI